MGRSIENSGIFMHTNVMDTAILVDSCFKLGIKQYHQVATSVDYGGFPLNR